MFLKAVAIVIVIVGAFAMKARNGQANVYECAPTGVCELTNFSLINQNEGTFILPSSNYYSQGTQGGACGVGCTGQLFQGKSVYIAN